MDPVKKMRKDLKRLERAAEKTQRMGNAILDGILGELNKVDPGWTLEPTGQEEVIFFMNGPDCISVNLESGAVDPVSVLTDVGMRGLAILADEVDRKMDAWLNITRDMKKKRLLLLERTRTLKRAMDNSAAFSG